MQKTHEVDDIKNETIPRVFNKYILLLIVFIFLYLCFANLKIYIQNKEIKRQELQLREILIKEESLNSELREKLVNLDEPLSIEVLAREKLGMIKKGEIAYLIAK